MAEWQNKSYLEQKAERKSSLSILAFSRIGGTYETVETKIANMRRAAIRGSDTDFAGSFDGFYSLGKAARKALKDG
jgi:hypothetical protein